MIFKKTPVDKKYDAAGDDEDGLSSEKYPPLCRSGGYGGMRGVVMPPL